MTHSQPNPNLPRPQPISSLELNYNRGKLSLMNPPKHTSDLRIAINRLKDAIGPMNSEIMVSNRADRDNSILTFIMCLSATYLKLKWKNASGPHVAVLRFDTGEIQFDTAPANQEDQYHLSAILSQVGRLISAKAVKMFRPKPTDIGGQ